MDWGEIPYFVEIRTVGDSEQDDWFNAMSRHMITKLNTVPSSYSIQFVIGERYIAGSGILQCALNEVIQSLEAARVGQWKRASLYLSKNDKLLISQGDPNIGLDVLNLSHAEYQNIKIEADFVAHLTHAGFEQANTPACFARQFKIPPEPTQTHNRLKKILVKKRVQLPKSSRGIIVLDLSQEFVTDNFSVEAALYGDLVVRFERLSGPAEPLGEATVNRNAQGFFGRTSRVSAVVIHRRTVDNCEIENNWHVYPTNRADADTIRLTLAELQRFGDLEDREQLTADNCPNI